MPSNTSTKQISAVRMKQQPSRKKISAKSSPPDSVSETISFVIKGKLTPIKPTYVTKKIPVRKQQLKIDKVKKVVKKVVRKGTISSTRSNKTGSCLSEGKKTAEGEHKCSTSKKSKQVVDPKHVPKPRKKIVVKKTAVSVTRNAVKKAQNLRKNKVKLKKIIRKIKPEKMSEIVDILPEEKEENQNSSKADDKKKKTVAKILKQAKEILEMKKPKSKAKTKVVNKNKPKITKTTLVNKNKPIAKITEDKIEDTSPENKTDCEIENEEIKTEKTVKTENKEDSTSDDNNLEEIRKSLKTENKEPKGKLKKSIQNKNKAKLQQNRKAMNKIKKARLEEQKLRKLKLYGFWNGPKRKRVASLNAIAKVHCLYENEGKISMLDNPETIPVKREVVEKTVKVNEKKEEERVESPPPQRSLRCVPGLRGVGKHWDMHNDLTSTEEESSDEEPAPKKVVKVKKEPPKKVEETKVPKKRKRKQTEIVMDLKDMVVRKRMASLNATAILAASYSQEKRSSRSPKSDRTDSSESSDDDLTSDEERLDRKYEDDVKKEEKVIEVHAKPNKKVAVIVNQDTDVTITGVYVNSTTRSTHHEGYCSIAGMQYRISATSHTQTAATAVATETLLQSSTSSSGPENVSMLVFIE